MIERRFGESAPFTLGVEEELMILDAETLEPRAAVDVLVRESATLDLPGTLKTELHASVVELNTSICESVDEATAALRALRRAASAIAERHGLTVAGDTWPLGGDIIVRADGVPVTAVDQLRTLIGERKPGDTVDLLIDRGSKTIDVKVKLGRQPLSPLC